MPSASHPSLRLLAVDLRDLSEEQMEALRLESMRRGVPLGELLGQLVDETSKRLLKQPEPA